MVRRAPFPLSRIPASIEHSMKLLCVCYLRLGHSHFVLSSIPPPDPILLEVLNRRRSGEGSLARREEKGEVQMQ